MTMLSIRAVMLGVVLAGHWAAFNGLFFEKSGFSRGPRKTNKKHSFLLLLGRSWGLWGRSWGLLGPPGSLLSRSWGVLGRSWSLFGRS